MSERKVHGNGIKSAIVHLGTILLMFLCFLGAVFYGCRQTDDKNIYILTGETSYTPEEAFRLQKQATASRSEPGIQGQTSSGLEIPGFAVWGEKTDVTIVNPRLSRQDMGTVITVCGASSLVLRGSVNLDCNNTTPGCLLDEEMCLRLFGSTKIIGAQIQIEGVMYEVRGLLYDTDCTVLAECISGKENVLLDKISIEIPEGSRADEVIRKLENQMNLPKYTISLKTYQEVGRFVACLLPGVFLLTLLGTLTKNSGYISCCNGVSDYIFKYDYILKYVFKFVFIIFLIGSFFTVTGIQPAIPTEWIPTRWSDFEFFGNLWQQKQQELVLFLKNKKTQPEQVYLMNSLRALALGTGALILYAFSSFRTRRISAGEVFGWCICVSGLAFLMLLFMCQGECSLSAAGNRMIWLAVPVCLWEKYLLGQIWTDER